jgi:hypothetical protein
LAADGELAKHDADRVQAHLAHCWTCRARMREIDGAISDFIGVRRQLIPPLPPVDGPRALLKLRLAELDGSLRLRLKDRAAAFLGRRARVLAWGVGLGVLVGIIALRSAQSNHSPNRTAYVKVRSIPDPRLTPGATLPLTKADVCSDGMIDAARVVPASVAKEVFTAYGIDHPEPRAYEVDYLITPALGGSDNIRNFWPQPYKNTIWNAHIKDALEDHLQRLICEGQLDLATAQHEIAVDWISAYKKYFQTNVPLPEHSSFLKDRPWE